jgi:predicted transcriptional regulator
MIERGISGLPVVDGAGQLLGIVTEGDFLRRAETGTQRQRPRWLEILVGPGRLASDYVRTHGRKVADIMTPKVVTVSPDTPVQDVVGTMEQHRIKRVPVVRDGAVVGIVSRANLVQALARLAEEAPPSRPDDEAMRAQIMAELNNQEWGPPSSVNVIVRDGVAELWGTIFNEKKRDAMRVLAENVPGIVGVQDHMVWVEPISGMTLGPPGEGDDRPMAGPIVP